MIHPRIILVTAEVVATMRGVAREVIYQMADGAYGGESYLWVFNIATNPERERELRFWSREINAPAATKNLSLSQVVQQIVPRREGLPGQFIGLRNWEVGELLRVPNVTLLALRGELQAVPHNGGIYVPRAALENFFARRWCYANVPTLTARK